MAGSYNHIVTDDGNLISNEEFPNMIENLGDAYEAIEEMYGMIWWLANLPAAAREKPRVRVEMARLHYDIGLKLAKQTSKGRKMRV